MHLRNFYWMLVFLLLGSNVYAAGGDRMDSRVEDIDTIPRVFLIGEYENQYENLYNEYNNLLIAACNNDINTAYEKWLDMLIAMENYSESIKFDIKGVKIWLNVFWNSDGSIKYLAYYLKPESKNMKTADMNAFFNGFIRQYKLPIKTNLKFTHYGFAAFPVYARKLNK